MLDHLSRNKKDLLISQKIHFIVYPENHDFMIDFYIKVRDTTLLNPKDFKTFSGRLFEDSLSFKNGNETAGGTYQELKEYVSLLNNFEPLPENRSEHKNSAIMVNYSKEKNEINFYEYEDILAMKQELILENSLKQQQSKTVRKKNNRRYDLS